MTKIYTLTLAPSLDSATQTPQIYPEGKLRCSAPVFEPGGGGINVARAVTFLGGKATAIFPVGGATGEHLAALLADEQVPVETVETRDWTRQNLHVHVAASGEQYRFVMPGAALTDDEFRRLEEKVLTIEPGSLLVVSGSLPPGISVDNLMQLVKNAQQQGLRCIIDSSGDALAAALDVGNIELVKPNQKELSALVQRDLSQPDDVRLAAQSLIQSGKVRRVVVSLGPQGALGVDASGSVQVVPPPMKSQSTVGAGDSMVGAMTLRLAENASLEDMVRFGVAAGSAATINQNGALTCRAERVGQDTTLSQVIRLVRDAAATKAPLAKTADRVSGIFVPTVICIAAATFVIWLLLGQTFTFALARGISVLVISCPCALGLATPVAIMVGSGVGAKNGILFKTAASLETTGYTDAVLLDKTGTVTTGEPNVVKIFGTRNVPEKFLLSMAAGLELRSEHPLARAILQRAEKDHLSYATVTDFEAVPGKGLRGKVAGKVIAGGNADFIRETCALPDDLQQAGDEMSADGITPLYFSLAGKAAGVIGVSDVVKESSAAAIAQMQTLGLQVVMLTGDNAATARHIGAAVGLDADHVIAGVLPAGKEAEVRALQKQGRVAMVGDGINDAPALTRAETGIAIGAGADVALDAADVVLVRSDLADVPAAVRLSRAVVRNIHQNLFWAFFYNAICIPLAAGVFTGFGITLNPMIASAAMSLSSVCVVTNALRLNTFDPRNAAHDAPPKRKAPVRASAPEIPCPTGSCPVQPAPENKTTQTEGTAMKKTIHIEGMMCGHCEATVKKALEALDGVQSAEVSHEKGTAVVSLTHDVADADLKTAVEARDYTVTGIDA